MELKIQEVPCSVTSDFKIDKGKFTKPTLNITLSLPYLVPTAEAFIPFTDAKGKVLKRMRLVREEFQWETELKDHVMEMKKLAKHNLAKHNAGAHNLAKHNAGASATTKA